MSQPGRAQESSPARERWDQLCNDPAPERGERANGSAGLTAFLPPRSGAVRTDRGPSAHALGYSLSPLPGLAPLVSAPACTAGSEARCTTLMSHARSLILDQCLPLADNRNA